ncbi:MAG TPA: amino acid permease [Candidatus Limnocylindrales bacterium]|nr:amino acid permease [Candidatus Limnocylindrales bacterium]
MPGPSRDEAIQQDIKDLHGLGYAQELFRTMGGFSNFAISFSIISILTGAVILYDYGLAWAGKAAVTLGWPLITIFVLCIAAAMAEIASAYPTAGGLYYWASRMKNKNWGWWTAWLNLIGQFAIVAGINYAAAGFINLSIIDRIFGGSFNTFTVVSIGADGTAPYNGLINGQLITMGVLMLIQLAMNIAGINLVATLNQVSVWWHVAIVAIVALLLLFTGKPDQSGLDLFAIRPLDTAGMGNNDIGPIHLAFGPASTYPLIAAFFFSLLQANWTYTGYDASAHVAEETIGARVSSAWGVFLSVAVSAVVGYIFLMALALHTPSLSTLFPSTLDTPLQDGASQYYFGTGIAVKEILVYNLGSFLGDVLAAGIAIAMAFCGLSSVAAAGRMLYAFARDDGLPTSGWLKKVSRRYRTPANSLTAIVVVAWLFSVAAFIVGSGTAIVIVTAVSTIFLYAAYGMCIYLGATTSDWLNHRVWSLGRWSKLVAWIAVAWCVVLMGLFSFPTSGNISWPFMVITVLLLLLYYVGWARKRFKGPRSMGAEQQLTDIEQEFNQAAGKLSRA